MLKRVLDVGQCGPDHFSIRSYLTRNFDCEVVQVDDTAGALAEAVNLRAPGQDALFFDALATGLLCPLAMPLRRVSFPKGAPHAGETHRLLAAGSSA